MNRKILGLVAGLGLFGLMSASAHADTRVSVGVNGYAAPRPVYVADEYYPNDVRRDEVLRDNDIRHDQIVRENQERHDQIVQQNRRRHHREVQHNRRYHDHVVEENQEHRY